MTENENYNSNVSRRTVLSGIAGAMGLALAGRTVEGSSPVEDRFVVDTASTQTESWKQGVTVVEELPEIDVAIVEGDESQLSGLRYTHDFEISMSPPETHRPDELLSEGGDVDPSYLAGGLGEPNSYQWDKRAQNVGALHEAGITGSNAIVSVVDQGVDPNHPDLESIYDPAGSNTIVGETEVPGAPVAPSLYHGTHVAGIAVGTGDRFTLGTAPEATLISQNIEGSGGGAAFSTILMGVSYSIDYGADAINISYGGYPIPPTIEVDLIVDLHERIGNRAYREGSLIVCSAGNTPVNLDTDGDVLSLPNEAPGFMSISATGPIGFAPETPFPDAPETNPNSIEGELDSPPHLPAFYTSYGPDAVDLSAAGGNAGSNLSVPGWYYDLVFSCAPTGLEGLPITWAAGTSMAAPQVTGLAAVVASQNPDATPTQVRQHLQNTARHIRVDYDVASYGDYFGGVLPDPYESETYRGNGHIDVQRAGTKPVAFAGGLDVAGRTYYPADPDDDGRYEDVNGDGSVDMDDVELLYQMALRNAVGRDATAFDFNGDGHFDMYDVQELIRQIRM